MGQDGGLRLLTKWLMRSPSAGANPLELSKLAFSRYASLVDRVNIHAGEHSSPERLEQLAAGFRARRSRLTPALDARDVQCMTSMGKRVLVTGGSREIASAEDVANLVVFFLPQAPPAIWRAATIDLKRRVLHALRGRVSRL